MKIGSDIDDVFFDWFWKAHDFCVRAGITNGKIPSRWEMYDDYGCTQEAWLAAVYPMALEGAYLEDPDFAAIDALARIKWSGHEIHLITARGAFVHGEIIREHTRQMVDKWLPWVDSLTFSSDKTKPKTKFFIEDNIKNYDKLEAAGIRAVLINRPHNLITGPDKRLRVDSVEEFADLVLASKESSACRTAKKKALLHV